MRFAISIIALLPFAFATPVPAPQATGAYTITCYYDNRAADPVGIAALLNQYQTEEDVLDYPWTVYNFGAVLRANGDTKVKVSTAVREARENIVATCKPATGDGNYGGLVDLGSHRVRIAAPGN